MYQPPIGGWLLIGWCSVPVDFIMTNGIPPFPAAIARIALYSVDKAVLYLLYDAYMICQTVLTILIVPVKENNIARTRLIAVILPESEFKT